VVRLRVDVCVCPFFRGYCKDKALLKLTRRNISIKKMLKQSAVGSRQSAENTGAAESTVFAFNYLQIAGNNQ